MRKTLPAALLLSALLAACASDKDALKTKDIAPDGALKVHPGLLGAQGAPMPAVRAEPADAPAEQPAPR